MVLNEIKIHTQNFVKLCVKFGQVQHDKNTHKPINLHLHVNPKNKNETCISNNLQTLNNYRMFGGS